MKTVRFDRWDGFLHTCDTEGDQSGEYVRAEDVRELVEVLIPFLDDLKVDGNFADYYQRTSKVRASLKKLEE